MSNVCIDVFRAECVRGHAVCDYWSKAGVDQFNNFAAVQVVSPERKRELVMASMRCAGSSEG